MVMKKFGLLCCIVGILTMTNCGFNSSGSRTANKILTEIAEEDQENLPEKWEEGLYLVAVTYESKNLIYTVEIYEDLYDIDDVVKYTDLQEELKNPEDMETKALVGTLKAAKANYVLRIVGKQSRKGHDVIVKYEDLK